MVNVSNIKTIKSNSDYMAIVDNVRLRYTKDDNGIVWIHSKNNKHGGFYLDRFNGELSPESIRMFHQ